MRQARSRLNQQIYEQAGDWLVRYRGGDLGAADRKAFDAWLRASPEHIRAYLEMSALWEDLGSAELWSDAQVAELMERAAAANPVVSMSEGRKPLVEGKARSGTGPESSGTTPARTSWASRHRFRLAAAIATLAITMSLITWWVRGPSYSTGIGEQRSIVLADGSTVELNARSQIRVHFIEHERDIVLVHGQALFHVAKDAARPFIVRAGGTLVRAVGTQFDVNDLHSGAIVTVVEGLVAVFGAPASRGTKAMRWGGNGTPSLDQVATELLKGLHGAKRPIFLSSGEQLRVTSEQPAEAVRVNLATATAWTQHRFVFDAAPLEEVVAEFNRYNTRQLVVVDPQLDDLRINGFFSSTDPALLLRFLRSQSEITIDDTGDEIRISKK